MDFVIPEDLKMLQSLARQFVREELLPIEKQVEDKDEFPEALRLKLKKKSLDLGLWNFSMPKEYGGGGVGYLGEVLVYEELGHVSYAIGCHGGIVGVPRSGIGGGGECQYASKEQIQRYFLPVVRGEKEPFLGLTEPNAGSDIGNMETRAVRDGAGFILNGSKLYITGVDVSDFGYVFAVTDWEKRRKGGISCFIVEKSNPGLQVVRRIPLMGRRGLNCYELKLDNCVVPADSMIGAPGKGLDIAGTYLNSGRLKAAASSLGGAVRALELVKSFAKQRVTFGEALARRQLIQHMIVQAEVDIHASRLMLYEAATGGDRGEDIALKAMMVKWFVPQAAKRIVDDAIQIHGGLGYSRDLPLEMIYRDVRLSSIGGGAAQVLEWTIARNLLKD
ncbi:MAG: acyl-CoA dehydrogenase family protein [Chloroflexi bacterium]|nr:acyl-CoA dehydrogenase family protein [Chloroflexota bacterium]